MYKEARSLWLLGVFDLAIQIAIQIIFPFEPCKNIS